MFRSLEIFQQGLVSPRVDKAVAEIIELLLSATKLTQNRLQARIFTVFTSDLTLCIGSDSHIKSKMQSVQKVDQLNMKEHHTFRKIRSQPEAEH